MSLTFDWLTLPEFLSFLEVKGITGEDARRLIHRILQEHRVCVKLYCDNLYGAYGTQQYDIDDPQSIWDAIAYEIIDFKSNTVISPGSRHGGWTTKPTVIGKDIKVYRKHVEALFSYNQKANVEQTPARQSDRVKPGPKRKQIIDLMWAEMARRAYRAEWTDAMTQKQAIDEMEIWVNEQEDGTISRDSIKDRVSMLWHALKWSGEN